MAKVQIKVVGLADTKSEYPVYLLMLREVGGERALPLLIGETEAHSIMSLQGEFDREHPFLHDVMYKMIHELRATVTEVHIYKMEGEVFSAYIVLDDMGRRMVFDALPSDGIALALRTTAPIYVEEDILNIMQERIVIRHSDDAPVEVLTEEELRERMDAAVEVEDYEKAAELRDEMKRRADNK